MTLRSNADASTSHLKEDTSRQCVTESAGPGRGHGPYAVVDVAMPRTSQHNALCRCMSEQLVPSSVWGEGGAHLSQRIPRMVHASKLHEAILFGFARESITDNLNVRDDAFRCCF